MDAEREICGALAVLATSQVHLARSSTKVFTAQYPGVDRHMALESIAQWREALAQIEAALTQTQREAA
jgi:hypothetical protein